MLKSAPTKQAVRPDFYQVVKQTELQPAYLISQSLSNDIYLKREDLQSVHSFKLRGAYYKMLTLSDEQLARGVITASAGNHAQGVALGARLLGSTALVVMPETVPSIKAEAVKRLGAEVVLFGQSYSEAFNYSQQITKQTGREFIHPFDDELVIDGQGTVAEEILSQLPDVDYIFVPVGGGGLLAGVAKTAKLLKPQVKIIGVEPDDSDAMTQSLRTGTPVTIEEVGIFADGVAVKRVGDKTFQLAERYVDEMVTVSKQQICSAIKEIFEESRAVLEPAGALAMAGLKDYVTANNIRSNRLVAICSGANVSFSSLEHIVQQTKV